MRRLYEMRQRLRAQEELYEVFSVRRSRTVDGLIAYVRNLGIRHFHPHSNP